MAYFGLNWGVNGPIHPRVRAATQQDTKSTLSFRGYNGLYGRKDLIVSDYQFVSRTAPTYTHPIKYQRVHKSLLSRRIASVGCSRR